VLIWLQSNQSIPHLDSQNRASIATLGAAPAASQRCNVRRETPKYLATSARLAGIASSKIEKWGVWVGRGARCQFMAAYRPNHPLN
jgi:hypothetical protein